MVTVCTATLRWDAGTWVETVVFPDLRPVGEPFALPRSLVWRHGTRQPLHTTLSGLSGPPWPPWADTLTRDWAGRPQPLCLNSQATPFRDAGAAVRARGRWRRCHIA